MKARLRQRLALDDDSGAVLVLALIIVTVVALVVGGLLSFSDTSLRTTVALRAQAASSATADGAAQAAINVLKRNTFGNDTSEGSSDEQCFGTNGTLVLPNLVPGTTGSDPYSAAVSCTALEGTGMDGGTITDANKPDQAILTLSQSPAEDGLSVKPLNKSIPFRVAGKVISASTISVDSGGKIESNADVYAHGSCSPSKAAITVTDPAATVSCNGAAIPLDPGAPGQPDAAAYLPDVTSLPPLATVPSNCSGSVVTFSPGYYRDASALSNLTSSNSCKQAVFWFKPGTYYFDFQNSGSHQWQVTVGQLVAGTPTDAAGEILSAPRVPATLPGACLNPVDNATENMGVQFIFGGDSQFHVDKTAEVEICGSYHKNRPPIAIYGVGQPTTGLRASSGCVVATNGCALLSTHESFHGKLYVQGTTYAPLAPIDLVLSNVSEGVMGVGVISRTLTVKETGSFNYTGAVIQVPDNSPGNGPQGAVVDLDVYVCENSKDSPACSTATGRLRLRARVFIQDPTGARNMLVQSWAVLR